MEVTVAKSTFQKYPAYKDSGVDWLGEIPEHWEIIRFRNFFKLDKGLSITKENLQTEGVPTVNYGEIHSKYGFEVNPERHELKCVALEYLETSKKSLLKYGDFIFADTSEDIEGSGNFAYLNSKIPTFAGYHTIIAKPKDLNAVRFIAYLFDSKTFRSQIKNKVKGVKVYSITNSLLKNTNFWLPPLPEQTAIAEFLDRKTGQIERAVAQKEKMITLLKERKQIVIQELVTGKKVWNEQQNTWTKPAKVKDSGVEWIGEIPEGWEVKKISYVAKVETGATPDRSKPLYWNGKIPWVKTGEVNYNTIYETEECISLAGLKNCSTRIAPVGTLLMAMYGQGVTRGRVSLLGIPCAYNQACCAMQFNSQVDKTYSYFYFVYAYPFIRDDGNETSQMNISAGYISNLKIAIPPLTAQSAIIRRIESQSAKIDKAIRLQEQQIEKLKELKASMIDAAVTGKINIV
jgi:type I restriction enzyme, S subunit